MAALSLRGGAAAALAPASAGLKVALQAGLTALNVACWAVPLNMPSFTDNPRTISLANAFSGGVFLSLAFGHLLPHAIYELTALHTAGGLRLPLGLSPAACACCMAAAGYLVVFLVERILFDTEAMLHEGHAPSDFKSSHAHAASTAGKGVGAVLLLSALAVHSLVETALGVQSTAKSAYLIAASIGLHQPAESVALLVALVKAGLPKQQVALLLGGFSAVGPLGVACGLLAKEVVGGAVEPLLVALTAGTFLYVAATEVVAEEFASYEHCRKGAKVAAFGTGIGLISAVVGVSERLEGAALGH